MKLLLFLIINLNYLFYNIIYCGSCSEAKLCCVGRDSSCVVQKTPINAILLQDSINNNNSNNNNNNNISNEKPCYCDHACIKLGDCCEDFKRACDVSDCVVSPWDLWKECDTDCGTGLMTRRRIVLQPPINGGKHCPPLIQKRGCLGTKCPHNPTTALKEMATILPTKTISLNRLYGNSEFDKNNNYSKSQYYKDDNEKPNNEYCVLFEVIKATKACRKEPMLSILSEGERICVRCDSEAMRPSLGYRCPGHGTMDRTTRWNVMFASHCHGQWVRIKQDSCSTCSDGVKFVFV